MTLRVMCTFAVFLASSSLGLYLEKEEREVNVSDFCCHMEFREASPKHIQYNPKTLRRHKYRQQKYVLNDGVLDQTRDSRGNGRRDAADEQDVGKLGPV